MPDETGFSKLKLELSSTNPLTTANPEVLEAVRLEAELGISVKLPPSYIEFAESYGYGLLLNLFIVYIPLENHCDNLAKRSRELQEMFREGVAGNWFEYEPDGSPQLIEELVPFGISENGHYLAWHLTEPDQAGEYPIYVVGSKLLAVRRAASNLADFIEKCTSPQVKEILGTGYNPLPAQFKPLVPVW